MADETSQSPAIETPEAPASTPSVVEKDGEIFISQPVDPKATPAPGSAKETPEKASPEQPGPDKAAPEKPAKETPDLASSPEDHKYAGKSREEIIAMHQNAESLITDLGQRVSKIESRVPATEPSLEDVRKQLTASDLRKAYTQEQTKLNNLDPVNDEQDYKDQQFIVDQLKADWEEKHTAEIVNQRFTETDNQQFLATKRADLEKSGVKLTDAEFKHLTETARSYAANGKLSDIAIEHALLDQFGDRYRTFQKVSAEQKVRADIKKAGDKAQPEHISATQGNPSTRLVRLDDMSSAEIHRVVSKLSDADLEKLYQQRIKRK